MRVINAYTIAPDEIQPGDVMLCIIKAMVTRPGRYRLYRCAPEHGYTYESGAEIPRGDRITNEREVCETLFPSLAQVAVPDLY